MAIRKKDLHFRPGFRVLLGNARGQAAEMVIQPGRSEGGPENRHPRSDQCLFVMGGVGVAIVEGKRYGLHTGSLILIDRGARHEIRNTGRTLLKTLNFYIPPAY